MVGRGSDASTHYSAADSVDATTGSGTLAHDLDDPTLRRAEILARVYRTVSNETERLQRLVEQARAITERAA